MSNQTKSQLSVDADKLTLHINSFTKAYLNNTGINEAADILIGTMRDLGLHYGHSVKARRGRHPILAKTAVHKLDIFLAEAMKESLLEFSNHFVKLFKAKKPFVLISKHSLECVELLKFFNGCFVKRWIPGTITNSQSVLSAYQKKYGISIVKRPQYIISLVSKIHNVVSLEVKGTGITFLSAVDSDVLVKKQINSFVFFINDESIFFTIFFDVFISSFLTRINTASTASPSISTIK